MSYGPGGGFRKSLSEIGRIAFNFCQALREPPFTSFTPLNIFCGTSCEEPANTVLSFAVILSCIAAGRTEGQGKDRADHYRHQGQENCLYVSLNFAHYCPLGCIKCICMSLSLYFYVSLTSFIYGPLPVSLTALV